MNRSSSFGRKALVGMAAAAAVVVMGASGADALTLYQASNPGCPAGGWKLRTLASVNGPWVDHGIGPSSGSITYVRRTQNSSTTIMSSNVKWAYPSAGYMRINTAGNITWGSTGGANCWM